MLECWEFSFQRVKWESMANLTVQLPAADINLTLHPTNLNKHPTSAKI